MSEEEQKKEETKQDKPKGDEWTEIKPMFRMD